MSDLIYTDGACSGNGTSRATGGFGIYIAKSCFSDSEIKINKKGNEITKINSDHIKNDFYITNIRMEGLAIAYTLMLYADQYVFDKKIIDPVKHLNSYNMDLNGYKLFYIQDELKLGELKNKKIEIVTDSLFWMNVIQTWMPNWIRKNILLEKKNPDILLMLNYYNTLLTQNGVEVVYTHVKSHQLKKRTVHADGNDVADVLATSAVKNKDYKFTNV